MAVVLMGLASGIAVAATDRDSLQIAQTSDEQDQPVSAKPDSFTATFADWTLSCARPAAQPEARLACGVSTVVVAEGQSQPFAQFSLADSGAGGFALTALVPVSITVGAVPLVATDEADPGLAMPWLACTPSGCLAQVGLTDEQLQRLRGYAKQGRFQFTDSAGNQVRVNFSFRGLSQALDAMVLQQAGP